jgi:hypothetical protein
MGLPGKNLNLKLIRLIGSLNSAVSSLVWVFNALVLCTGAYDHDWCRKASCTEAARLVGRFPMSNIMGLLPRI